MPGSGCGHQPGDRFKKIVNQEGACGASHACLRSRSPVYPVQEPHPYHGTRAVVYSGICIPVNRNPRPGTVISNRAPLPGVPVSVIVMPVMERISRER